MKKPFTPHILSASTEFESLRFLSLKIAVFFGLLLLSNSPIWAQSPRPETRTLNNHHLSFSVYPIGNANWNKLYYQAKPGKFTPITFWAYERSPKHDYTGPIPIHFYDKTETLDPDGNPVYKPVGTVTPTSASEQLFFFVSKPHHAANDQPHFQIIPLNESPHAFPLNTVTFVNVTGANLEGVFGNQPIFLKEGISSPYPLKPFYQKETLLGLAVLHRGNLKKVLHCKWSFYPNYREIILLLPPATAGNFRIQAFRITQHKEEITPPQSNTDLNT